jgi:hypothetical protein
VAGQYHSFVIRRGGLGRAAKIVIEHQQTGAQVQVGSSAEAVAWISARCHASVDGVPTPATPSSPDLSGEREVPACMEDVGLCSRHPGMSPA